MVVHPNVGLKERAAKKRETNREGVRLSEKKYPVCNVCKNEISTQTLEVPLLGLGTVLRLRRDAWAMVT